MLNRNETVAPHLYQPVDKRAALAPLLKTLMLRYKLTELEAQQLLGLRKSN